MELESASRAKPLARRCKTRVILVEAFRLARHKSELWLCSGVLTGIDCLVRNVSVARDVQAETQCPVRAT
jgi:hypothetical protein